MTMTLVPGRNCWRVETAKQLSLIVDGEQYFRALRHALISARHLVVMIGWDFDFEMEMLPGESDGDGLAPDALPNRIGPFLDALVDRRESLDIYLLKWSGGALIAPGRALPALQIKFLSPEQIHLAFDGHHPIGACHHQKIVVIDDALAFCGGIDATMGRWDSRDHAPDDPRRTLRSGRIGQPWHDAAAMLTGPAARALGELARARWDRANDAPLPEPVPANPAPTLWPDDIEPDFEDAEVAIARTHPPERDAPSVAEIEAMYLDAIAAAKRLIYIESQYFSADSIAAAVAARLAEPDGPEIVVINPHSAQGPIEDAAMHVTRSHLHSLLTRADRHGRFRLLYPVNAAGDPIYVHAKIMIVDDWLLRVGSSNIDRRSMGFDTEADLAVLAHSAADRTRVRELHQGLLAEHLGVSPAAVADRWDQGMIAVIEGLSSVGPRGLRPILPRDPGPLGLFLARTRLFDPRYRRSAQGRLGLTSRHVFMALGAAAVAVLAARSIRPRRRR